MRTVPQSPPPVEGTTVTVLAPVSHFTMPSPAELLKLADIVRAHYPNFVFTDSAFASAFRALGYLRRTDAPDRKHYASHWCEECEIILRSWSDGADIGAAFLPAVLAHFDIPFSDWTADGVCLEVGLDSYTGRPATDAWKRVLSGELPRPVGARALVAPQPVRVFFS